MEFFSYSTASLSLDLIEEAIKTVNDLRYYFVFFNKARAEEAMHLTLVHIIEHRNTAYESLVPYTKKLARVIMNQSQLETPCQFLGDIVVGVPSDLGEANIELLENIDEPIIESLSHSLDKKHTVYLALTNTHYFSLLCECYKKGERTVKYFPKEFKELCYDVSKNNSTFKKDCLEIYDEYRDNMKDFLGYLQQKQGSWRPTDYTKLDCISSRVKLKDKRDTLFSINKYVFSSIDIDNISYTGTLGKKKIIRVKYIDIWDKLCDMIDSDEDNALHMSIDGINIFRTPGGTLSLPEGDINEEYAILRDEILCNIIILTNGKLLGNDTEYFYLLVSNIRKTSERYKACNIDMELNIEDITDQISQYNLY